MMTQTYINPSKLQEMGDILAEVYTDVRFLREFSNGFSDPSGLTREQVYGAYIRSFAFFNIFHTKAQMIERKLDDIIPVLLEADDPETLREYLDNSDMITLGGR